MKNLLRKKQTQSMRDAFFKDLKKAEVTDACHPSGWMYCNGCFRMLLDSDYLLKDKYPMYLSRIYALEYNIREIITGQ